MDSEQWAAFSSGDLGQAEETGDEALREAGEGEGKGEGKGEMDGTGAQA